MLPNCDISGAHGLAAVDRASPVGSGPFAYTVQFGGRYIVLGGKLVADVGSEPKRLAIIAFDSMDKAQDWLSEPTGKGLRDEVNRHAKTRAYTVEGTAN